MERTKLTYFLFFFLSLQIMAISIFAQDYNNSLQAKSWALQFGVNEKFYLKTLRGSTLSIKHHMSEKRAIRMDISVSADYFDNDRMSNNYYESSQEIQQINKLEGYNGYQNLKINIEYLFYRTNDKRLNLFKGIGPLIAYSRSNRTYDNSTVKSDYSSNYKIEENRLVYNAGISALIGVEWFILKDISAFAEYLSSIYYYYDKRTSTRNDVESRYNDKTMGFRFESASVMLGLAVYF